jgi:MFS family permease
MMCSAFLLLAFFNDNVIVVIILMVVQGVGLGMLYVIVPVIVVHNTPPERTSEATGMMGVIRSTAMAIGAQTVATLLAVSHSAPSASGHAFPDEAAYQMAFFYVAGTAFIALLLCQMLPKTLKTALHH